MDNIGDILHVLLCMTSPEREAVHEAGHRFFYRMCFPNIRTHYGRKTDGLPAVISDVKNVTLANLTPEEASRWIYIKLGGFASELIFLGYADKAESVAERIVLDWFDFEAGRGRFDLENEMVDGDIPNVVSIIKSKSEWTLDIAMRNFKGFFKSCIENMQDNPREYAEECRKAMKFFVKRK